MSSRATRLIFASACVAFLAVAKDARALDPQAQPQVTLAESPSNVPNTSITPVTPPPLDIPYLQYGVAFTTEFVTTAGHVCSGPEGCILGSGGGIAIRVGRRSAGPWYFGGAYEMSKQDPASLYRFATLQQLRAEARWYLDTGFDTQPYGTLGAGLAGYGNEWGVDTWGPMVYLGIGVESQISRRTVVGITLSYRAMELGQFDDSTGARHGAGVAQLVGIDLTLEQRDPLKRLAR